MLPKINTSDLLGIIVLYEHLGVSSSHALGIGAASFWSAAEKDIAESPTAERSGAGTPKGKDYKTTRQQDYKLLG